ncbi:ABC transporter ATP-binding protein [Candidatus Aerophobetes bacterium]|uniref:ABC transporter ATP-binding protein n=1 Tax=Aerophobetes bacterium TaxID=2030807 RepID=A0A523S399_UNCAE|nr:MAG: ABC transporter ATP-binding protein [Candidatus Aerophobetes bacterium]
MKEMLLEIKELETHFFTYEGVVKALNKVDLTIYKGETLGLVGETGCGKSVTALSILRLVPAPPGKIVGGKVFFEGENLLEKEEKEMRKIRGSKISMIFQNPTSSLNPVFTVGNQVTTVTRTHQKGSKREAQKKATEMFELVRLPDPERTLWKYPHELSGGMQQRIMIAMALSCEPSLLIADEPTTALDVTIQAQVLNLIKKLKEETKTSILLITHNLGIVAKMCDRVVVMYAGEVVEEASLNKIFEAPKHPYTVGLLGAIPKLNQKEKLEVIKGSVCSLIDPPQGCRFYPRCSSFTEICQKEKPARVKIEEDHFVSCHLYNF